MRQRQKVKSSRLKMAHDEFSHTKREKRGEITLDNKLLLT